jgi:hypothetical protein
VYEDLPITSTRCPVCGFRRGFRRLYDSVNVSRKGPEMARVIDGPLGEQLNAHSIQKDAVKATERQWTEERDRAYEVSSPEVREQIATVTPPRPVQWKSAAAQFGMVPPEARAASAWPFVKRTVVPRRA